MTISSNIPLYFFTYNCNKRGATIHKDISEIAGSFPNELADLYVFSLQELCDTLTGCFARQSNITLLSFNQIFLDALDHKYGQSGLSFRTIGTSHVGATGIIAISPYSSKFSKVRKGRYRNGYGYSSLKGAAGLRMFYMPNDLNFFDQEASEITLISVHLPAYEGEYYYRKRNAEMQNILRGMDFGDGYGVVKPFSHCFVMGDLNYRTSKKYDLKSNASEELFGIHDQSSYDKRQIEDIVKKYDELAEGKTNGDVLMGFSESCITFAPTYKYYLNTGILNNKRSPSWCDRIFYQSTYKIRSNKFALGCRDQNTQTNYPRIHEYNSIDTMSQSDHRPVFLQISVPIEAPETILSRSGYLQLLPSETANSHYLHNSTEELDGPIQESITGPTQIYMKPTIVDTFIQSYLAPLADFMLGYSLWFLTTSKGRLLSLILVLSLYFALVIMK